MTMPGIQRTQGAPDPLVPQPLKGKMMATPDAATMKKLQAQGKAIPNASGDPSFPVRNGDDLAKAIKAVGRVQPNTDAARGKVRRYLIARAKALGLSSQIPDSWNADGSLKDASDSSDGDGDSDSGSDSSSGSGSSDSSSDDDSSDDDMQAAIKKLVAKGMSPAAARIFAQKAAAKKAA